MIATLCAALFALGPPVATGNGPEFAPTNHVLRAPEEKIVKALEAWLKAYRAGRIEFNNRDDIVKNSIAAKYGVLPKGLVGAVTYQRELEIMLQQAVELDTAEAADALLGIAAVGLDPGKYTREMAPHLVRDLGEMFLVRLKSAAAREYLLQAARGETKVERSRATAVRAAALRALGTIAEPAFRTSLEQELGNGEVQVRLAAAEALKKLGNEASAEALVRAMDREESDLVLEALIEALRSCYARFIAGQKPAAGEKSSAGDKPVEPTADAEITLPESSRLAVRAVVRALGRTTWRADMTLIGFLDDFRSPEAVPALIEVLQRFKDNPEDVLSGKLSGLLLHRAHETLVAMTGAVYAADKPELWRELWERQQGNLQIAKKQDSTARRSGTVSQGLFGIPVQGTRVIFVIDLSGSMNFAMPSRNTGGAIPDRIPSRWDRAREELLRVVGNMPEISSLNCITFNGLPKAKSWSKDLIQATAKNKDKFRDFVEDMRPDGGTNLWAGLEEGLKMKSLVYGDRYDTTVDELFLISDGAPSVGDVQDPVEILRLVTETNRFSRVRINTVFITSPNERNPRDTSMAPAELMKRMAEQNGGRFVKL